MTNIASAIVFVATLGAAIYVRVKTGETLEFFMLVMLVALMGVIF